MNADTSFCRDSAERFDRDRFILTLAAPADLRPDLWAVLAFNHEIAKTRDVTREVITGHIRLTWWRDAILEDKYSHEVLTSLRAVIEKHALPKSLFVDLIDARMRDADNAPPPALDAYAAQTNLPLLQIFASILKAPDDADTLRHLSIAYGLTGLMRALAYFIRHDDRMLPADALSSIGIAPEQFSHIRPDEKLFTYVRHVVRDAQAHLDSAQPKGRMFIAMKKMTRLHLKVIEKAGYNPFDAHYHRSVPFMALRVLF